ncbi:MAG TPA: hypothetical protein VL993_05880 [Stellaceae bacterium]|nr:hypothetical protein [Stellaceae bacterium]
MFELSVGKLLVLAALILVVIVGWKRVSRVEAVRDERRRNRESAPAAARSTPIEDLVRCAACGSFVAAHGAMACGRADCPWQG